MIFIDETKAKYFFNSLENCNNNYDFFNAGVNYVLQELAKKEVEKENNKNCVFDSYKMIDKYRARDNAIFEGVYCDVEKQCEVYTNGQYLSIENKFVIGETSNVYNSDNKILECRYPNYMKVVECNDDIKDIDCKKFFQQVRQFDKLQKSTSEKLKFMFTCFNLQDTKLIFTQFNTKKLAYWLKCHYNFYAMFETFKDTKLTNCVSKIKLFDDKNNMLVLMCTSSDIYSDYFNIKCDDINRHNEVVSKTITIND